MKGYLKRRRGPGTTLEVLAPVIAIGLVMAVASYVLEVVFDRLGIPPASTVLDNIILGIMGAILVGRYLQNRDKRSKVAAVKARLEMVGELNRQIRGPLSAMSRSLLVENREERLRCADEALERIDHVLNLSLPAVGAATASRAMTLQ